MTGALVPPGPPLTAEEVTRYSRHLLLPDIGVEGQRRLKNSRVLVVGAGGLGSPALTYLAAAGVGVIGVVDDDVVEESNLQRQVLHSASDVGRAKVDSAAAAVARLNPLVTVVAHQVRLSADNARELVDGYDLVLDGADNFSTRYLVSDVCALVGIPEVWGSVLRFDGQVSVFWSGHGPTYRDLFPEPPPPGAVPSCAEGGVLGALCASIGSVMATEAVKLLTGAGRSLLGRLLVLDALDMTWRTIRIATPAEPFPVTHLVDEVAACAPPEPPPLAPADLVSAPVLAEMLTSRARGELDFDLVDVRGAPEAAIVAVPGARLVPLPQLLAGEHGLSPSRPLVLLCKAGGRSAQALRALRENGFADVRHLDGGVLAWVREVDPTLPTY